MSTRQSPGNATRHLNIGDIIVTKNEEEIVWSVLGSCISVILYVPNQISILCHAQMPSRNEVGAKCFDSCPHPCFNDLPEAQDSKYVKCSVEFMIEQLYKNNGNISALNTTLIGGASIISQKGIGNSIGELNIKTAKDILENQHIRINRELIGGSKGYTLWYYTKNDRLFVRKHSEEEPSELLNNR